MHPMPSPTRLITLLGALLATSAALAGDLQTERTNVEQWRSERVADLTSETGWLTLVGLYWLSPGENTIGRAPSNTLVLDHPNLATTAGTFVLSGDKITFTAKAGSGITHAGEPVTTIEMVSDAKESPTVISSGTLRFFIIERAGKFAVRVRDVASVRRREFRGLEYFPISSDWVFEARFEPYEPVHHIKIVNVLGMEDDMVSPGAVVLTRNGQEIRLDAVLDGASATDLFIMFADGTSGHDTYGAGRFLHAPFATEGKTVVDFNKAYNPPCAFNTFGPPARCRRIRIA